MRIVRGSKEPTAGEQRANALHDVVEAREAADKANAKLKEAEHRFLALLEEQQLKSSGVRVGKTRWLGTLTSRTTYSFNESGLRKALTAKVYDKYTVRHLDRTQLKKAVENGDVDASVVAQYTTPHTSGPFLRLTHREIEDDDGGGKAAQAEEG